MNIRIETTKNSHGDGDVGNPFNHGGVEQQVFGSMQGTSVFSGTRWTALSQVGTQAVKFAVSLILARLLVPQDFGLMAMALVVTGFMDIFKELGTVAAIVQRKELTSDLLSSIFYFNILVGFVTGGGIAVGAPTVAWVYGDPRLSPILQALSLIFVISSCGLVKKALLQRNMRFDRLAVSELSGKLVHGVVAVVLAILGWGIWALVGGALAGSIISTMLLWVAAPWMPQLLFRWSDVTKVFHFSLNLTGALTFHYFLFSTDRIVIGRFLGATSLGFYELAQRIIMAPVLTITQVLTRVLFPDFSRIQNDNREIQRRYLRACGGIALITFPALAGLSILARPFVLTLFGPKWNEVIPLIVLLSPVGIIQSIATTVGVIYLVKGRTDWLWMWEIVAGTCLTLSFILGLRWGIVGVGVAYLIAMLLLAYPGFAVPFRLIGLRVMDLVSTLRPYATVTIMMLSLVLGCRLVLESFSVAPSLILVVCAAIGVSFYTTIILLVRPQALLDFQKVFLFKDTIRKGASVGL